MNKLSGSNLKKFKMEYSIRHLRENYTSIEDKCYFEDKSMIIEAVDRQEAIKRTFNSFNFPIIIARVLEV